MIKSRWGSWDVDLETGKAQNGKIEVKVTAMGDQTFDVAFSGSASAGDAFLLAKEVLIAFEHAGVRIID